MQLAVLRAIGRDALCGSFILRQVFVDFGRANRW
jgi:hypothetical protein